MNTWTDPRTGMEHSLVLALHDEVDEVKVTGPLSTAQQRRVLALAMAVELFPNASADTQRRLGLWIYNGKEDQS